MDRICIKCGETFSKSQFGLTVLCDSCYRKKYAAIKKNYKDSGHFYPWTINGKLRNPPRGEKK